MTSPSASLCGSAAPRESFSCANDNRLGIVVGPPKDSTKFSRTSPAIRNSSGSTSSYMYVTGDHLGSVSLISDASGGLVAGGRQSYDPWGLRRNADGTPASSCSAITSATTRGYTGQEEMDSGCLVNLNGRIYDPVIGRMLSADPTIPDPLNTQSYNRYSYVNNNPLNTIDPSGFDDTNGRGHCLSCLNGFELDYSICFDSCPYFDAYGPSGLGTLNNAIDSFLFRVTAELMASAEIPSINPDATVGVDAGGQLASTPGLQTDMGSGTDAMGAPPQTAISNASAMAVPGVDIVDLDSNTIVQSVIETVVVTGCAEYCGGVGPIDVASKVGSGLYVVGIPLPRGAVDPLDPKGLNKPMLTPIEQKSLQMTLSILQNGTDAEREALNPHIYMNFPDKTTGAVLPPGTYTTFDVPMGSVRGNTRLVIENTTLQMFYTNNHYLSFYVVHH